MFWLYERLGSMAMVNKKNVWLNICNWFMGFDQSRYFFIIDKTLMIFFLKPDSVNLFIQL